MTATILNPPPGISCLLLLLTIAPGCSALNALNEQQPTASFRSVKVTQVSPSGVNADFAIDVQNPNSFDLPVNAAACKLSSGGVQVIDDTAKPTGSVPANGTTTVDVTVHFRFDRLLQAEKGIVSNGGNLPFDYDGSMEFSLGKFPVVGAIKAPLHFSGTLPFRDAVNIAIRDAANLADLLRDPSSRKFVEAALGRKLPGGIVNR